ncbi:MAG TPA: hypothetical protein VG106_02305, partial [Vicinamibacterales bacterium]|nr:hypothetical protein [Vicinamibacterales bacterium]
MPWAAGSLRSARDGYAAPTSRQRGPRRPLVIRPAASVWASLFDHIRALPEYRDLLLTLSAHRINVR